MRFITIVSALFIFLTGCNSSDNQKIASETSDVVFPVQLQRSIQSATLRPQALTAVSNPEAVIPPQCYTKHNTEFNPCMTCHQTYPYGSRPNTMNDGGLQREYAFSDIGLSNHWRNLFEDRSSAMSQISNQQVIDYIYTDNYSPLIEQLNDLTNWQGPIPDIKDLELGAVAFDEQGFAKDGSHWVAFNYKPMPSTFWPTNGSTDDVMIRLPESFRTAACTGNIYSKDTYLANLAILEASIKNLTTISVPTIDENEFCTDLNGDNQLSAITEIIRPDNYVGEASAIEVTPFLYPQGVEFLHSVRYVGITEGNQINIPPRMKELRYMQKYAFYTAQALNSKYINEQQEKVNENLPKYIHRGDKGTDNGFGWYVLGFIEDENGSLRMQNEEEQLFCMGCHTTLGTTIDQTFAFPRKVTGADGWKYIDLRNMKDSPTVDRNKGEILHYLETVGGGNEFRENDEIIEKFFHSDGSVNEMLVKASDVYSLITPSIQRAYSLNKAYMTIVKDQDFIDGRDANIQPAVNVHQEVNDETKVLAKDKVVNWDVRLNWE